MKQMMVWLATAATLHFSVGADAAQSDPRLNSLFTALRNAASQAVADRVEAEIWEVWSHSGRKEIDQLMAIANTAMARGRLDLAVGALDQVVKRAPQFAEGWNKRATVYYMMGDYEKSVADVERTLALEPRHFGALSGLGLIALALGQEEHALEAFETALEIHPFLSGHNTHIKALREKVQGKGI